MIGIIMTETQFTKRRKNILSWFVVALMGLIYAFVYQLFIVKNKFAPAGISGIAVMLEYKLGFSIGYFAIIINIPLCIAAFFLVDKEFALKSFVFTIVYSVGYILLGKLDIGRFQYDAGNVDTIFPCMLAGTINGFCMGVCFRMNGSTGGSDIIGKYVSKVRPFLNFFAVTFVLNAIVAVISYFVYGEPNPETGKMVYNYKPVCLCILYCFLSGWVGNAICKGSRSACNFMIITTHPQEIEAEILKKLHHGVTEVSAIGAYSHQQRSLLICVVNHHQQVELRAIVAKYEDTFAFVYTIDETIGKFDRRKHTVLTHPLDINPVHTTPSDERKPEIIAENNENKTD